MSFSGSQHQFGLSDLQILQQRVMLNQLQELQKQQQHGQLGDVKTQNPINHLSRFGKQASADQIQNFNGGMPVNASEFMAASNTNWMHHNVSASTQGTSSSSYLHDRGLMMNPSVQQPDVSFYGTPVASGRDNLGLYSPLQGASQNSRSLLSRDSEQKSTSQAFPKANSLFGDKHSFLPTFFHSIDSNIMTMQGVQGKGSGLQNPAVIPNSGVSLQNSPQVNSLQQNMSLLEYGQPGCTGFPREKSKQASGSQGTDKLDPLEEKILFDTEDSGWDSSLSKLAAIGTEESVNTSGPAETMYPSSTVQSGSWCALMQSAVAEASSSDTCVQEELSGLSFQNIEMSTDNRPSNLVTSKQQHVKCSDSKSESSSYNLKTPPSSCDSIMSSALPSFQLTGLQLTFEQGVKKISSDINNEQWPNLSQSSESQQQSNQHLPVKHVGNDWVGQNNQNIASITYAQKSSLNENCWQPDVFQGSKSSALSKSGTTWNNYQPIQQQTSGHQYMTISDGTLNQMENKNKSLRYGDSPLKNSPMAVDTPNKNVPQTYASQIYQGENSSDSYNSKVCHAYTAQPDHACSNAADSESSARSSQKSPNQGKPNLLVDALSKCDSAFNIGGLLDKSVACTIHQTHQPANITSQNNSELDKASLLSNYGGSTLFSSAASQTDFQMLDVPKVSASEGGAIPDIFSFQSSEISSRNRQKGQTWWMPSSFGHSVPPLQGALAQNWSGKSSTMENSGFDLSNLKTERSSHGSVFPGPLFAKNQLEWKSMSDVSVASEFIQRRYPEMGQQMSLSGFSQDSCLLENAFAPMSDSDQHGMKPNSAQVNSSSQRDVMVDSYRVSSNLHAFRTSPYQHGKYKSSLVDPSSRNSQISKGGEEQPELNSSILGNIAETDVTKVNFNSSLDAANLMVHQNPDFYRQQRVQQVQILDSNPVGSLVDTASDLGSYSSHGTKSPKSATRLSPFQHMHSQKVPVFGESNHHGQSSSNKMVYDRIRNLSSIDQTAPAMYTQYEDIKHMQILSQFDAPMVSSAKKPETFQFSRYTDGSDGGQGFIVASPDNQMVTSQQVLSSSLFPADLDSINLIHSNSRKRKLATFVCLPWHKEVMQTSRNLPEISIAEQEWAEATNRLIDRRVDVGDILDDKRPVVCAKKRLILTTQLMQQVFRPSPPSIVAVDAASGYELMTYFSAKVALADICSLFNKLSTDCHTPHEIGDIDAARPTNASSNGDNFFKAAEEFVGRVIKLESHIDGLDRSLSAVDVRLECQELEKFYLINHFAKYHSRLTQSKVANLPASTMTISSVKPFVQRYVSAVPLPQNLPEETKCLSL